MDKLKLYLIPLWFFLASTWLNPHSLAGTPPAEPILRPNTSMHTASIQSIGVDADEQFVLTASRDKTLRLWDMKTGQLLHIYRVPIAEGYEGQLYSGAISPDGRWVAAGGWTGYTWDGNHSIYIFDRQSSRLVQRLQGLGNVIMHLCFAPQGHYLAATLGGKNGLHVYSYNDPGTFRQVAVDSDYAVGSMRCQFDNNGRLVTTSYDSYVRLYDPQFQLLAKEKVPGGNLPYVAAFSPDGERIAVGFDGSPQISVLSGKDLHLLYQPDTTSIIHGDVAILAWSSDGEYLYGGGHYAKNEGYLISRWSQGGRGEVVERPVASSTLKDIWPLKNGGVIVAAADPALVALHNQGTERWSQVPSIADMRKKIGKHFRLSREGRRVIFGLSYGGGQPAEFDLATRHFRLLDNDTGQEVNESSSALIKAPGLLVTGWEDTDKPQLNGKSIAIKQHEISRSLAIHPDGKHFALGTEWFLRYFDRAGRELWRKEIPDVAWGVNISGDGRWLVAALGDGILRWYRTVDGELQLSLFPHRDGKRWVLWSPGGYYDAAPGADSLIGWYLNNGKDQAPDFYPASLLRNRFYRPGIIAAILHTQDEAKALRLAGLNEAQPASDLKQNLPPLVTLLAPVDGSPFNQSKVSLKYRLKNVDENAPLQRLRVLVDGRPIETARGLRPVTAQGDALTVELPPRDLVLSVIAENRHGASTPASVALKWAGANQDNFVIKPKLYVLAIGVSDYQDDSLDLQYAAKDARNFSTALQGQQGWLYREVDTHVLENATKDQILDGLEWLERNTTSKDVAMLFFAGHGVNDNDGKYYFLSRDASVDHLRRTGVPHYEIERTLGSLAGKTLAFIDTCHAGNVMGKRRAVVDINRVANDLAAAENGVVVFMSSTGRQYSLEDPAWQNGAFTKALIEGLSDRNEFVRDGRVTLNMLDLYISERVKQLTGGRQTPTTTKPGTIQDFPIAVLQ